jgi:hypothetical protein
MQTDSPGLQLQEMANRLPARESVENKLDLHPA